MMSSEVAYFCFRHLMNSFHDLATGMAALVMSSAYDGNPKPFVRLSDYWLIASCCVIVVCASSRMLVLRDSDFCLACVTRLLCDVYLRLFSVEVAARSLVGSGFLDFLECGYRVYIPRALPHGVADRKAGFLKLWAFLLSRYLICRVGFCDWRVETLRV